MLSFASVSYFRHNLLLKIPIDSELIILKGNSIFYNFYRNREIQISMFSRPKMRFKLPLKIMTFSEHFFFFFHDNISKKFSKEQIRCHKEKHFFYYFFKKNEKKIKSNKKSHLINYKLILVRTNQN